MYILYILCLAHKQTLLSGTIMPGLMCHRRESQIGYPKKKKKKKWGCREKYEVHLHASLTPSMVKSLLPRTIFLYHLIAIVTAGTTATNNNRQVINANHNQDSNRQKECCLSQAMQIAFAKLINQRIDLCLCRLSKR